MTALLEAIAASGPAAMLRTSTILYPLVNAFHILSIGALVTSVLLMDLRVLGLWKTVPAAVLIGVLRPVAFIAFGFALLSGFALFSVRPLAYAANPAFLAKLALIAFALVNALAFFGATRRGQGGPLARALALLSLLVWPLAAVAGRFVGFIE